MIFFNKLKRKISDNRVRTKIEKEFQDLFKLNERLCLLAIETTSKTHWNYGKFEFLTVNLIAQNLHRLTSISLLLRNGLAPDAWPIFRSMIEAMLDYDYIYREPTRVDLYFQYSTYLDIKKIERAMKTRKLTPDQENNYTKLKSEWAEVEANFKEKNGKIRMAWRDKSLYDISVTAGMEVVYTLGYQEANDYVHGNSNMIQTFVKGKTTKGLVLKAGSTYEPEHTYLLLVESGLALFHILMLADHKFNLGLRDQIVSMRSSYTAFPITK